MKIKNEELKKRREQHKELGVLRKCIMDFYGEGDDRRDQVRHVIATTNYMILELMLSQEIRTLEILGGDEE